MREEHPSQSELPGLSAGGPAPIPAPESGSEQVREMSEVAVLQAKVLVLGLVKESRPVFVYDANLAKEKSKNAERQEKFRLEREKEGLKMGLVPIAALEKIKKLGGGADGWAKYIASLSSQGNESEPKEDLSNGVPVKPVEIVKFVEKIVDREVIKEVPGPTIFKDKIVVQHDLKLTSEQKKSLALGEKVQKITGWRAFIARKLLNI